MNQNPNFLNQNNSNTQSNNEMSNNQNFNNAFHQNTGQNANVNGVTFSSQPTVEPISQFQSSNFNVY